MIELRPRAKRLRSDAFENALGGDLFPKSSNVGVAHISHCGTVLAVSASVSGMLGYDPGQCEGAQLFDYLHPEDTQACKAALGETRKTGGLSRLQCRIMRLDGGWRMLEVSLAQSAPTMPDQEAFYTVNFTDITAYQNAQSQAAARERELEHLMRLHSMGELAAALSHELKQPIAAIGNFIGGTLARLDRGTSNIEAIKPALEAANAEAIRAGLIITRVRAFVSRREPIEACIALSDVLTETREFISSRASNAQCRLIYEMPQKGSSTAQCRVLADPVLLGQVLLNIAFNGIEAMDETDVSDRRLVITLDSLPNAHRITIRDRGCGLPDVSPDQIFEPFFTTKPMGSGIGLSLCRSIVEAYGGHLWLSRDPDGTRVHISLPKIGLDDELPDD